MKWKIVIKQLMLFVVTVVAVVTGSAVLANAKALKPATAMPSGQVKANRATSYRLQAADNNSGTVGSVTYSIANGTLTLNSGEISADTPHQGAYKYPWAGRDDITEVKITGPIKLDSAAASEFFWSMPNLEKIDGLPYLDTTTATDMVGMFAANQALTSLDLSGIKTPEATNMTDMFAGDASLTSLNVSTLNTSKVTEMSGMFAGDSGLSALNVSNFVTDNVLYMDSMFSRDSALKSLDVSNFKTSKVQNMTHMFADDSALTNLNVNNFNTSNVIYMSEMFRSDSSLASLNVASFDTKNVYTMEQMFAFDYKLKNLDLKNFETPNVRNMFAMFGGDYSLGTLNLENFDTTTALEASGMNPGIDSLLYTPLDILTPGSARLVADQPSHLVQLTLGPKTNLNENALLVEPFGGKHWQAVGDGTVYHPTGTVFEPTTLAIGDHNLTVAKSLFDSHNANNKVETYVPENGIPTNPVNPTPSPSPTPSNPTPTPQPQPAPTPTEPTTPSAPPAKPTIPNYAAKKKAAAYAIKAVYLYKQPNFNKSQRIAKYPKQKRINRPMFVVIDYARSNGGALRYKVRDVNHGRKSAGKVGYITADWQFVRPVYYRSMPMNHKIRVISLKGVHAYKNKNLTGRVKSYKKGTRLTVKKIVTHNLTTRFQLSNGLFVTGNKKLVIHDRY